MRRTKNIVTVIIVLVICHFRTSAQDIVYYSDVWQDDETGYSSDPELQEYYIATGATVDMISGAYHTVRADLELTSPAGSYSQTDESCSMGCRGTSFNLMTGVYFGVDNPPDAGNYQSSLEITPLCPEETEFGSAIAAPVGVSYIAMAYAAGPSSTGWFRYDKVPGCQVYCNAPQSNWTAPPWSYCIQLQIPYVYFCSPVVRVKRNPSNCVCFDVNLN